MYEKPQAEHEVLQKLVGDWKVVGDCTMPDGSTDKNESGVKFVSIGGLWVVGDGSMPGQEGVDFRTIMTLGFDPVQSRYVGTFVASCMTKLWVYNGIYDAAAKKLVLDATGPRFDQKPGEAHYKDTIEFVNDDQFILSSQMQGDDGKWFSFMKSVHHRVK
jgi:Protein of unknown function (DUF1579)